MAAIKEYRAKERQWMGAVAELTAAASARDDARRTHDGLRKRRLDEFMAGFSVITLRLKEMYQMITLGGDAELELVDSLDPFREGIVFSVRPPRKSWKNIGNLSGGEKTLSSLALVFALHHYRPTPLYVMDEIDAALDFKNVRAEMAEEGCAFPSSWTCPARAGVDRRELHQGAHEGRAVHRHLAPKQHVRAREQVSDGGPGAALRRAAASHILLRAHDRAGSSASTRRTT